MSYGQNLRNKGLMRFARDLLYAANALAIMCSFYVVRKVRCHKVELWKTFKARTPLFLSLFPS